MCTDLGGLLAGALGAAFSFPDQKDDRVTAHPLPAAMLPGCVLNDDREVLLVKDKHEGAVWKFPGGLADAGEGIAEAAAREVFEETGVEAEFRSVLTMRHQHNLQFGNSDMYFICRLTPKASGAQNITRCTHEIADACWMPLEQFRRETKHSMLAVVAEMLERPEETELGR